MNRQSTIVYLVCYATYYALCGKYTYEQTDFYSPDQRDNSTD
jgi:hypothetical protein